MKPVWPIIVGVFLSGIAMAEDAPIPIVLKDHRFTPAEIHVVAGQVTLLDLSNADPTPEEFDMKQPAIEKVVVGGGRVTVRIRALGVGRYPFIGEYHEATAQGVIIADPPAAKE